MPDKDEQRFHLDTELYGELTDEDIAEFQDIFDIFDKDGDGSITNDELGTVMKQLGQEATEEELKQLIGEFDEDDSGELDFQEFCLLMIKKRKTTDIEKEMIRAFHIIDINKDGFVTPDELKMILTNLGENVTEEDVDEMFREADLDADGRISFEEFQLIMS
ncbi:hypothetical protein SNEBB_000085 [Seison nebaliae]|nr:hypothetical protein SNEBB_000085 [Seison nebaliae]